MHTLVGLVFLTRPLSLEDSETHCRLQTAPRFWGAVSVWVVWGATGFADGCFGGFLTPLMLAAGKRSGRRRGGGSQALRGGRLL